MQKRQVPISTLKTVINILATGKELPAKYRNHKLKGDSSNVFDLHIQSDWILLYTKDKTNKIIKLVRTGSHSDLFK